MRFLLRMAFWLTVIFVMLPSGGSAPPPQTNVSAIEAMSAARATVTDMRSFCERQPDACAVGSQAAVAIGHRAQAGAKMLYEYLNEQLGPGDTNSGAPPAPGKRSHCPRHGPRKTRFRRPIWLRLGVARSRARKRVPTGRTDPTHIHRTVSPYSDQVGAGDPGG